jgi:hypothetical protein
MSSAKHQRTTMRRERRRPSGFLGLPPNHPGVRRWRGALAHFNTLESGRGSRLTKVWGESHFRDSHRRWLGHDVVLGLPPVADTAEQC